MGVSILTLPLFLSPVYSLSLFSLFLSSSLLHTPLFSHTYTLSLPLFFRFIQLSLSQTPAIFPLSLSFNFIYMLALDLATSSYVCTCLFQSSSNVVEVLLIFLLHLISFFLSGFCWVPLFPPSECVNYFFDSFFPRFFRYFFCPTSHASRQRERLKAKLKQELP